MKYGYFRYFLGCNHIIEASAIRFPMIYNQLPTVAFGPLCDNFYKPNEWVSQELTY